MTLIISVLLSGLMIKMSRSYRHSPWMKCAGDTEYKKIFNRKLRRCDDCQDIPDGNAYKKMNNSWDIADYRFNCSWEVFRDWYWTEGMSEEEAKAEWKRKYWGK